MNKLPPELELPSLAYSGIDFESSDRLESPDGAICLADLIALIQVHLERTGYAKSERLAAFVRRAALKHEVKARKWQELPEAALLNLKKYLEMEPTKL